MPDEKSPPERCGSWNLCPVANARCHLSVRYYRRDCYDSFVDTERSLGSISRAPIILIDNRSRYVIVGIMGFRASCVFSL
jgi:hypothetical protein